MSRLPNCKFLSKRKLKAIQMKQYFLTGLAAFSPLPKMFPKAFPFIFFLKHIISRGLKDGS